MFRRLPSQRSEPMSENASRAGDYKLPFDFSGQVCVVTGAGQGIGKAIAGVFAAHEAEVVIADLAVESGLSAAEEIRSAKGRAHFFEIDVSDERRVVALVDDVYGRFGRIDVVVHNAAYFPLTAFEDIDDGILARTLSVNLKAAFWLTQAALPCFKRQGKGRVLVTSSVTGARVAYPGLAHYAASKAGINGFIRAAALELAKYNVTVNGVEPGMIETSAADNLGDRAHAEKLASRIPMKRLGSPKDIAFAMAFLASDAASYVTGQTLIVDGGALLPECGVSP